MKGIIWKGQSPFEFLLLGMLHINKKIDNTRKKGFAAEVFVAVAMFSVFNIAITQASDITAENVINLVNNARVSANVAVLTKNDLLQKAAQDKAQDMISNNYFAHISPSGKSPWLWIENASYDYHYAGENLAINYTNAEDQQIAWMNSPLHRKNILNSDYQEIGVAVKQGVIDGHKTIVAVQMFGTKLPQKSIATVVSNTPKQESSVAGAGVVSLLQNNSAEKISNKIDLNEIYQNNKPTLFGWLAVFGIAFLIIIVDVAALIHKKHNQLFILHDVRNRHA
ncbi:MAG: hypothetical protein US70_C0001G0045 [Parcubacteria group bacterium GW2011_GWD2_38_11]|nr:MAG: hypothetical protein US70_C0001G0045 [Parcubacteria group bacterium GW2011_GWD2_38_11]